VNRTAIATGTALLIGARSGQRALADLVDKLGFLPTFGGDSDAVPSEREPVALCLIDLRSNGDALRAARVVRAKHPEAVIIGVADPDRPTASAEAIRAGVFDVLPRPPSLRDLETLLSNARELVALSATPASARPPQGAAYGLVGTSPAMRLVMELVQRAASGRCGILICGERGTGREMIARAIHAHGPHPEAPFVTIDCSGPAPGDIELDLFGVINKRAGTGAVERRSLERIGKNGRLVDAIGGILFIEHVTQMPARVQARLIRVLRDREVFVGADRHPTALDIRPIAAVDGTVEAAIEEGRLRIDLYERLALIRVDVPPLRMRREDIPVLATHFLKDICRANAVPLKTLTRPALTLLSALPWRGNAPELRGLLERLILLVPQGLIRLEDVLAHTQLESTVSPTGYDATLRQARARFERDYIAAVLQHQHGRIAEAAKILGVQRTNLYRKIRRLSVMRAKVGDRET
jgi:DNA-binding NtrC family response regulator